MVKVEYVNVAKVKLLQLKEVKNIGSVYFVVHGFSELLFAGYYD